MLTASDGEAAIELARARRPSLLLLDLQMPELDGNDTLRELRKRGHDLPVIFLTGHGSIEGAVGRRPS